MALVNDATIKTIAIPWLVTPANDLNSASVSNHIINKRVRIEDEIALPFLKSPKILRDIKLNDLSKDSVKKPLFSRRIKRILSKSLPDIATFSELKPSLPSLRDYIIQLYVTDNKIIETEKLKKVYTAQADKLIKFWKIIGFDKHNVDGIKNRIEQMIVYLAKPVDEQDEWLDYTLKRLAQYNARRNYRAKERELTESWEAEKRRWEEGKVRENGISEAEKRNFNKQENDVNEIEAEKLTEAVAEDRQCSKESELKKEEVRRKHSTTGTKCVRFKKRASILYYL